MVICVIVNHLPDGATSVRSWELDDQRTDQLVAWLDEPDAVQYLTPQQSEQASAIGDAALTVHRT